jgi:hypothetical protein
LEAFLGIKKYMLHNLIKKVFHNCGEGNWGLLIWNSQEATMKRIVCGICFVTFIFMGSTLFAQEYAEKTEYSFDDDVVTGDLVRPDGELTVVRKRGKERSLIRVRQHFIPEMLKSVEDL